MQNCVSFNDFLNNLPNSSIRKLIWLPDSTFACVGSKQLLYLITLINFGYVAFRHKVYTFASYTDLDRLAITESFSFQFMW